MPVGLPNSLFLPSAGYDAEYVVSKCRVVSMFQHHLLIKDPSCTNEYRSLRNGHVNPSFQTYRPHPLVTWTRNARSATSKPESHDLSHLYCIMFTWEDCHNYDIPPYHPPTLVNGELAHKSFMKRCCCCIMNKAAACHRQHVVCPGWKQRPLGSRSLWTVKQEHCRRVSSWTRCWIVNVEGKQWLRKAMSSWVGRRVVCERKEHPNEHRRLAPCYRYHPVYCYNNDALIIFQAVTFIIS